MPTFPLLPAQGSTSWYPWAQAVHNQVVGSYLINVVGYGADGTVDTGAGHTPDSTTAFQNAITAATAASLTAPAVVVYVPAGTYITQPLVLPNRVSLVGDGVGTTRILRANAGTTTGGFVTIATNARSCSIRNLTLNGNGVGGSTSHGVELNSPGSGNYNDARHHVEGVRVESTKGNGFHQDSGSTGVCFYTNCEAWICDGHGFFCGTDDYYTSCDAGSSGLDGFYVQGANTRLTSCKAWFSGRITTTGTGSDLTAGHGFHFEGNWSPNTLTCCEAQDNARAGFYIWHGGQQIVSDCHADSNNTANLSHAGFELIATTYSRVSGHSWDRAANTNHQLAGYRANGGGPNWINITARDSTMAQGLRTTDSDLTGMGVGAYYIYSSSTVSAIGQPT